MEENRKSRIEFEFVVEGPPFSVNLAGKQSKKHRDWKNKVNTAAKSQWSANGRAAIIPTSRPVEVRITTFFTAQPIDVDNVIKPILDSLKQEGTQHFPRFALYDDDACVYRVTSERVDLNLETRFTSPGPILAEALTQWQELVHITLFWESEG